MSTRPRSERRLKWSTLSVNELSALARKSLTSLRIPPGYGVGDSWRVDPPGCRTGKSVGSLGDHGQRGAGWEPGRPVGWGPTVTAPWPYRRATSVTLAPSLRTSSTALYRCSTSPAPPARFGVLRGGRVRARKKTRASGRGCSDVVTLAEPVSPGYRTRVREVSCTSWSRCVAYLPDIHRPFRYRPRDPRGIVVPVGCEGDSRTPADQHFYRGRDRRRSGDLALFRRALYQLSYPTGAVLTRFELATSALTGRRALQAAPQDRGNRPTLDRGGGGGGTRTRDGAGGPARGLGVPGDPPAR